MKRPLKIGLASGIITMIIVGALMAAFAKVENDNFQFCTTKAYGWPAPWRIDYCPCEGAKTVYPMMSIFVNCSVIVGSGITGYFLCSSISSLLDRHNKHLQKG